MVGDVIAGRMLLRHIQFAVALCALTSVAHSQTRPEIARGQEIAERVCAGCHAIDGAKGPVIQGTDVPSFRAIAGRPNHTPERLQAVIMAPHRPMPTIPLEMSEIRDVVAYILSLK